MADLIDDSVQVGRAAGGIAGFVYGVGAGSLIPIPIVGSFLGGVLGAIVGSEVGAPIGKFVDKGTKTLLAVVAPGSLLKRK